MMNKSTRGRLTLVILAVTICGALFMLQLNSTHSSNMNELSEENSEREFDNSIWISNMSEDHSEDNLEAEPQYNVTDLGELNGPEVKMDDPRLLAAIREKLLRPPPPRSVPYNLGHPEVIEPSEFKQPNLIRQLLNDQKFGFFVEAGAHDGEALSNTLMFERYLNWSGLLVEPDPRLFAHMVEKKRKAWLSPSCLSVHPHPHMVSFKRANFEGKISEFPAGHTEPGYVDVQCLPLYSLLLAMNRTTVDYLSLDVEGSELHVLETIPFNDLNIRTMSVEFNHVPGGKDALAYYLLNQGYEDRGSRGVDMFFSKRGAVPKD